MHKQKRWSYGRDAERSVRIRSDNTSSSLRARDPSSSSPPSFYRSRREPFGINFLPTESTYLGSSMYLILSYVQRRACVREESDPTLRCTDCACGRFSSRHRVHMHPASFPRMAGIIHHSGVVDGLDMPCCCLLHHPLHAASPGVHFERPLRVTRMYPTIPKVHHITPKRVGEVGWPTTSHHMHLWLNGGLGLATNLCRPYEPERSGDRAPSSLVPLEPRPDGPSTTLAGTEPDSSYLLVPSIRVGISSAPFPTIGPTVDDPESF